MFMCPQDAADGHKCEPVPRCPKCDQITSGLCLAIKNSKLNNKYFLGGPL